MLVDTKTADRLRQAADGVGAPSVGELLRLASLEPRAVQSAYLDGLVGEVEARRERFSRASKPAPAPVPSKPAPRAVG